MACNRGREIERLLSGQLSARRRARLECHLHDCEACQAELVRWQRLQGWLKVAAPVKPPAELVPQTLQRLQRELDQQLGAAKPRARGRQPLRWGWAAPALVAVGVLWLVISLPQPAPLSPGAPPAVTGTAPLTSGMAFAPPAQPAESKAQSLTSGGSGLPSAISLTTESMAPGALAPPLSEADRPLLEAQRRAPEAHRRPARPPRPSAVIASLVPSTDLPPPSRLAPPAGPMQTRAAAAPTLSGEPGERVSRALRQAVVHGARGDTDLRIATLENVAVQYPEAPEAAQALLDAAALESDRGNYRAASGVYQRVLTLPEQGNLPRALAYKGLGDVRRREVGSDEIARHNYGQAERILRQTLQSSQGSSRHEALLALGEVRQATMMDDGLMASDTAGAAPEMGAESSVRLSDLL